MKKPILITTLGFPGSGKTYFAENISKELNFFHLNSDKIRHTMYENPQFTPEETQGVFRLMDQLTKDLLKKGINVIYDANMNFRAHRKRLEMIAKKCGAKHHLVWIQVDVPIAEKRILNRGTIKNKDKKLIYKSLDVAILHKLKGEIEVPTKSEPLIVINGHDTFQKQLQYFKKASGIR